LFKALIVPALPTRINVSTASDTKSWLFIPHISNRAAREAHGTVFKKLRRAKRGAAS
jgi:hypothetical protein